MLPELTRRILDDWTCLFPGVDKPRTVHYLGIPGSVEGGTTTFLAFACPHNRPGFVVKTHRDPDGQQLILSERDVLTYLQTRDNGLAASVPKVILCDEVCRSRVLVETMLEGRAMPAPVTSDGVPRIEDAAANFSLAGGWLRDMHQATREAGAADLTTAKENALSTIQEFLSTFEVSSEERQHIRELVAALDSLLGAGVFLRHGDFCLHNILINHLRGKAKIAVIDWAFSRRATLPLHDLFFFVTTYSLQVRKQHGLQGFVHAFEYTFFGQTAYGELVKRHTADCCEQLGIDPSCVKNLFALFLIDQAVFEYRKVLRCSRHAGLPRLAVYLALIDNSEYHEALKKQLWTYFFRIFVKEENRFIM